MSQTYCVNQICVQGSQPGTYDCTIPTSTLTAGNCIGVSPQYITSAQSLMASDSQHRLLARMCCNFNGCSFSDQAISPCATTDDNFACVVGVVAGQPYVSCRDLFFGDSSNFCTFSFPSTWTPTQCSVASPSTTAAGPVPAPGTTATSRVVPAPGSTATSSHVPVPGSAPASGPASSPSSSDSSDSSLPIGAIAGGAAGAVAVIAIVGFLVYRSRRSKPIPILNESANPPSNQFGNQFGNQPGNQFAYQPANPTFDQSANRLPSGKYDTSAPFQPNPISPNPLPMYAPAHSNSYTPNGAPPSVPSQDIALVPVQSASGMPQPPADAYVPHQPHVTGAPAAHHPRTITTVASSGKGDFNNPATSMPYDGYSSAPLAANSGYGGGSSAYAPVGGSGPTKLEMYDPNPPAYTR
ncbi:uncharacterized protein BJ171DRAFT_514656 [Polychytrium aggregatum]|uniref:uncharacterized protein n=1 Tax=Polychytrium aggregatum TaxID=110093 RepID=UPI0022FEC1BC|nr:uncharacterized protein BJ171DRAFT_514656 [Polychytrium aggregatum]KAI9202287.1 hypothetical protein BJ171DRAFT_514656 [Polychytrium aggregatum]